MWRTRIIGAALGAAIALPAAAFAPEQPPEVNKPAPEAGVEFVSKIDAYDGLASWVDMYNKGPWKYPKRTAKRMAERGTKTLFLQTSNYRKKSDIYKPRAMSKLLEASHNHGMKVMRGICRVTRTRSAIGGGLRRPLFSRAQTDTISTVSQWTSRRPWSAT